MMKKLFVIGLLVSSIALFSKGQISPGSGTTINGGSTTASGGGGGSGGFTNGADGSGLINVLLPISSQTPGLLNLTNIILAQNFGTAAANGIYQWNKTLNGGNGCWSNSIGKSQILIFGGNGYSLSLWNGSSQIVAYTNYNADAQNVFLPPSSVWSWSAAGGIGSAPGGTTTQPLNGSMYFYVTGTPGSYVTNLVTTTFGVFIGNGSGVTGVQLGYGSSVTNFYSDGWLDTNWGTGNYVSITNGSVTVSGTIAANGNVTGNNITANGTVTGNNITDGSDSMSGGVVTAIIDFSGPGGLLTGLPAGQLTGTIALPRLPNGVITNFNAGSFTNAGTITITNNGCYWTMQMGNSGVTNIVGNGTSSHTNIWQNGAESRFNNNIISYVDASGNGVFSSVACATINNGNGATVVNNLNSAIATWSRTNSFPFISAPTNQANVLALTNDPTPGAWNAIGPWRATVTVPEYAALSATLPTGFFIVVSNAENGTYTWYGQTEPAVTGVTSTITNYISTPVISPLSNWAVTNLLTGNAVSVAGVNGTRVVKQ